MSGTKNLVNNSKYDIEVTLVGRIGADPNNKGKKVTIPVKAHQRINNVIYGSDENPYLNLIEIAVDDGDAKALERLEVTKRGGPGTIDNTFNAYNTLTFAFDPDTGKVNVSTNASNT